MSSEELVSVLIPNYNNSKYIKEAVGSVLRQSHKNIEIIIVDDGSTDRSVEIIKFLGTHKKIRTYYIKTNQGRPITRNLLLDLMNRTAKYFMWMDSDDILINDKLIEEKIKVMKEQNVQAVGSNLKLFSDDGTINKIREYPETTEEINKTIFVTNCISQGGLLLSSELKKYKYDTEYLVCQDYEMWTRMINDGINFYNYQTIGYGYRQSTSQAKHTNTKETIKNTLRIKRKYFKKHFSTKLLIRYCMETALLFLPTKTILWLFYKMG